jgi:hypothetical protein
LTAEIKVMNLILEMNMDFKRLVAATAIFVVAGGTYAQQTEFLASDAGFNAATTRAEVRMAQKEAYASGVAPQSRHDGQDPIYAAGTRKRQDVRAETIRFAKAHNARDVRDNYFGEELKRW